MPIPDNYDQWEAHDREQAERLKRLPVCVDCGEPIQDETAFFINGEWVCERCINIYRRVVIDE